MLETKRALSSWGRSQVSCGWDHYQRVTLTWKTRSGERQEEFSGALEDVEQESEDR